MPVYIEKINGDVDRPTDQPTDQQGKYRAICLFKCQKKEKRQRFAIMMQNIAKRNKVYTKVKYHLNT